MAYCSTDTDDMLVINNTSTMGGETRGVVYQSYQRSWCGYTLRFVLDIRISLEYHHDKLKHAQNCYQILLNKTTQQ